MAGAVVGVAREQWLDEAPIVEVRFGASGASSSCDEKCHLSFAALRID